jgi:hypothetical protein
MKDDVYEQEFYTIENSGEQDLRAIPIAGRKPWKSLPWKESATLDDWKFNIGDTVYVRSTNSDLLPKGEIFEKNLIRHLREEEEYIISDIWVVQFILQSIVLLS